MTNRLKTKVRLVKCPKCSEILPEPEQVPLYTCGGCGTILQAKYYRSNSKGAVLASREQDVLQCNGISHSCDDGESSGSSRRSSSSGDQALAQIKGSDVKAVENGNSENIGAENSALHKSLSEETNFLNNKGHEGDTKIDQFASVDHAIQNQRELGPANSATATFFSKDHTVIEKKESEQLPAENAAIEGLNGHEQYSGTAIEKPDQKLIREVTYISESSTQKVSEVLEKKELQQLAVLKDEEEQREQSIDIAFDSQKEVGHGNSAEEAVMSNESQRVEKPMQLAPEFGSEGVGSYSQMSVETVESCEDIAVNEITCLDADKAEAVAKLGQEDGNVKDHKFVEGIREQLEIVKLSSETPLTTEITRAGSDDSVPGGEAVFTCLDADKAEAVAKLGQGDGNEKDHNFVDIREKLESVKLSSETPLTIEITRAESDDPVPGNEAGLEACRTNSVSAPMSATDPKVAHRSSAPTLYHDLQSGTNSLDNDGEASRQKIENFDDTAVYQYEQLRSTDKQETLEPVDTHREVGGFLNVVPRSTTKGSPAYDGSISSVDGNDDQVVGQPQHVGEETSPGSDAVADYVCTEESPGWNNIPTSRATYSNSRIQSQAKSYLSMPLDEKLKSRVVEEEESVRENGVPTRYRSRPHRDGFPPRVPFYRRSSEVAYETGSSSSYVHDEPLGRWTHHHPYRYEDPEPWPRKTYMQRENVDRRRFSEATWRENDFLPIYYNNETSGEIYHRSKYQGYIDRRRRAESWSQSGTLPRTQYSGEVFNERYHMRDPYMHRRPDNLRWSEQLPPPGMYYRQGLSMAPSREASWDRYDAYPTSPQRFTDPDSYALAHDTYYLSDDQRYKDQIMKRLYLREKRQSVKRHLLPLAGAAPFITCYSCFKVLQLPDDFLLSRRSRKHRLKCGSCLSILDFSLENETCLAPCLHDASEGAETNLERNVSSASLSHSHHSHGTGLISGEARATGRESHQHNSFGALGREKSKLMSRPSRNEQRLNGFHDAATPAAQSQQVKITWQLPPRSKSPLHRLMGYPSPDDLLTGHVPDDDE